MLKVRAAGGTALHYEVTVRYGTGANGERREHAGSLAGVHDVLKARAGEILADYELEGGLLLAGKLLDIEMDKAGMNSSKDMQPVAEATQDVTES
jgi:hypothetical protein